MSITIDVICYTSKVLKNNEYPLMLRLTKDRNRKYKSLGVSTRLEYWDFKKNQPKPNTPNRELILELSSNLIGKYRKLVLEFKAEGKDFTLSTLLERLEKPIKNIIVGDYTLEFIDYLNSQNRYAYSASVLQTYNSLKDYNQHLNIYFSDIDIKWLKRYVEWLREKGLKSNTIGIRLRNLRAIYNRAIDEGIIKQEYYPFKKLNIAKLNQKTAKRSLSKAEIHQIITFDTSDKDFYTKLSINLFTFSYLMGGINFVDMALLTENNIIDNKLVYTRKKTSKLISLPMQERALMVLKGYKEKSNPYLFPILSSYHKTEQQRINRIHKVITKVNKALKAVGEELKIPIKLTTYVARHSFATVLKRAGVSTSIICESLGHSSEKVTQVYLDSFENSQIDEAMGNL